MAKIFTIANRKGGAGKTTLATNLAVALSKKGSTLLVDTDDQLSAYNWNEYRENKLNSLAVLNNLSDTIQQHFDEYDFILIDCPPSLKLLTSNALASSTHVVIPIESGSQYGLYGVTDLLNHLEKIKRINPELKLLGALLIKHDERQNVCKLIRDEAYKQVGHILETTIPQSTKVNQAAIMQQSLLKLDKSGKVRKAFERLAEEILKKVN